MNGANIRDDDILGEIERSAHWHIPGVPIYESHVAVDGGLPPAALELLRARGLHLTGKRHDLDRPVKDLVCARHIVQAGLRAVLYIDDYIDTKGLDYLLASGVLTRRVDLNSIPPS